MTSVLRLCVNSCARRLWRCSVYLGCFQVWGEEYCLKTRFTYKAQQSFTALAQSRDTPTHTYPHTHTQSEKKWLKAKITASVEALWVANIIILHIPNIQVRFLLVGYEILIHNRKYLVYWSCLYVAFSSCNLTISSAVLPRYGDLHKPSQC